MARYRGAKADIDSPFFKLHYRTTATLFFICCLLVTANDLIGSTISCFGPEGVPGGLLNTYCWIMSTFSVPGSGGAHPGLGPETGEETVHAYYQWVPFVLFLQGVMFYIPHYLWKTFEHKKIDKITSGVRGKTLPINTDKRRDSLEDLINYLWETRGTHESYAFKYLFCDLLNLIWWNLFGQRHGAEFFKIFGAQGPYDIMMFQECDDVNHIVSGLGYSSYFSTYPGEHAVSLAWNNQRFQMLEHGFRDVAEDSHAQYYGKRGVAWARLQDKNNGQTMWVGSHHGPLPVNTGGMTGPQAVADNIMKLISDTRSNGDPVILAGAFP